MSVAYINDLAVLDYIAPQNRKGESDLFLTKWWDYKMLHPIEACEAFDKAYREASKASRARTRDKDNASYSRHLHYPHFLENSKQAITGIWNARRAIDAVGIPYHFYCHTAFKFAERRNYRYMPMPAQIVTTTVSERDTTSMFEYVCDAWVQFQKDRFLCSTHEYYTNDKFTGALAQCQHRAHILKHIASSKSKEMAICHYVFEKQLIQTDLIEKRFGDKAKGLLRRAAELVDEEEFEAA